jgi:hypothetical protein
MTWLRLGLGARPLPLGARPALPLELFEFEGCPFCRKAREAISLLDLPTKIWPCPKGGTRFRPRAAALASRLTFPLLVDPNQPAAEQLTELELPYLLRPFAAPVAPVLLDGPQRLVGAAAIHAHLTARFELGGGA